MKISIKTKLPGTKSKRFLKNSKKNTGSFSYTYPIVYSGNGKGCYFEDLDGNIFLDFASQYASLPLGYNYPALNKIVRGYETAPVKYSGLIEERETLTRELTKISPKKLNAAFLINSGAEAVENAIKTAIRSRPRAKFGVCFENSFHGRTLGALSFTTSKKLYTKNYFSVPSQVLPYNEAAIRKFENIISRKGPSKIGFVIIEHIQGEGGYNIAPFKMVKEIRKLCKDYKIPYIADEVQSGLGRTGKWWSFEHYNIVPDIFSSAKALQVGATVSNKRNFPEPGAIGTTWGGGNAIDLAISAEIIKTIKKKRLLSNIKKMGKYLKTKLAQLEVKNPRGLGLMVAFDLSSYKKQQSFAKKCFKQGLIILPAGKKSIRLIPPYIVTKTQINQAISIIESNLKKR